MAARARRLTLPAVVALVALAVLVSLGNWQVRRLHWKEALIARVSQNMTRDAVALPSAETWGDDGLVDAYEYRPVRLTGSYLPTPDTYGYTVVSGTKGPLDGPGYWVMSPFGLASGGVVYVNRGFVPDGRRSEVAAPPAGAATIAGLLRASETPNWLTPDPDPGARVWYVRDVARMAAADRPADGPSDGSYGPAAPFFVDLDASFTPAGGLPQAGETRVRFANNHLQYAITWYGLALALVGVFAAVAWRELWQSDTNS